jgi:hypothetical protein
MMGTTPGLLVPPPLYYSLLMSFPLHQLTCRCSLSIYLSLLPCHVAPRLYHCISPCSRAVSIPLLVFTPVAPRLLQTTIWYTPCFTPFPPYVTPPCFHYPIVLASSLAPLGPLRNTVHTSSLAPLGPLRYTDYPIVLASSLAPPRTATKHCARLPLSPPRAAMLH